MNDQNTEHLLNTYPELYENIYNFACGDGWFTLIDKLSKDITVVLEKTGKVCEVNDVKEKYATLRVYTDCGISEIHRLIDKAEEESAKICEICGDPGKTRGTVWVTTLCEDCMEK